MWKIYVAYHGKYLLGRNERQIVKLNAKLSTNFLPLFSREKNITKTFKVWNFGRSIEKILWKGFNPKKWSPILNKQTCLTVKNIIYEQTLGLSFPFSVWMFYWNKHTLTHTHTHTHTTHTHTLTHTHMNSWESKYMVWFGLL